MFFGIFEQPYYLLPDGISKKNLGASRVRWLVKSEKNITLSYQVLNLPNGEV